MGKTHIEISKDARRKLRVYKAARDMTYDEAIQHLLEGNEELQELLDEWQTWVSEAKEIDGKSETAIQEVEKCANDLEEILE